MIFQSGIILQNFVSVHDHSLKSESVRISVNNIELDNEIFLKEYSSQLNNCYNSIHCNFLFVNN